MTVVYTKDKGRLISIDLDGAENIFQNNAQIVTEGQAASLLVDHPERSTMDEDDWFSY